MTAVKQCTPKDRVSEKKVQDKILGCHTDHFSSAKKLIKAVCWNFFHLIIISQT